MGNIDLQAKLNSFFVKYKETIFALHTKEFKEESIYDKSCLQFKVLDYYSAFYLVSFIYQDILENPVKEWSYYVTKYELEKLSKCYACKGIKLQEVFKLFGYPFIPCDGGIECIDIEYDNIVEPTTVDNPDIVTVNIQDYINGINICYTNLTN